MLTLVDTHAHLNSKQYDSDLPQVITSSKKAGIKKIIIPGFDLSTSIKSGEIANKYKDTCYATCGIHPYHANKITDLYETRKELVRIIEKYHPVAIGEVGLDYHLYTNEDATGKKDQQKELLKIEIELALEYRLTLILHCRSAWDDYVDLLATYSEENLRGVSHCFEGGSFYLQKLLTMGFYIGFNGLLTFNKLLEQSAKDTPMDRILLETDSPFLTPEPLRGTKNFPKNVRLIAKFIASLKNETLDSIASQTTLNAFSLFRLK